MSYKAFQDWYREGNIKHLLLYKHNDCLISPPFATERCPEYNKIMKYDGSVTYIDTDLPPAVSKTNCVEYANNSSWFIPYGIYENNYNSILQLDNDFNVNMHYVEANGKGQFYSGASDGKQIFSFPLGYEGTQYALHIVNDMPKLVPFNHSVPKAHMGTVFCNGKFYSMPRGDEPGYNKLVCFDGTAFEFFDIPLIDINITRKYTDLIATGHTLYSLPFGETPGITEVVEFDTNTKEFNLHKLNVPDFAKKYNCMVLLGRRIIALPYGDEHANDSNHGIVYDTFFKDSFTFDIGVSHGGKYRYRCGLVYNNLAVFFPSGTPQCPIIAVDEYGVIQKKHYVNDIMFGRPIIHQDLLHVIAYDTIKETQHIYIFDNDFKYTVIDL